MSAMTQAWLITRTAPASALVDVRPRTNPSPGLVRAGPGEGSSRAGQWCVCERACRAAGRLSRGLKWLKIRGWAGLPVTATPLTLLTSIAVRSALSACVEAVVAVQISWIGEAGLAKTGPVPPAPTNPVAVRTNPAGNGRTLLPTEVCLTTSQLQCAGPEDRPIASVAVTLYMPGEATVTEASTVLVPTGAIKLRSEVKSAMAPGGPCAPVAPFAPCGPVAPCAPLAPCGP